MTTPKVNVNEADGGLGVQPPSEGALYAVIGVTTTGDLAPQTFASPSRLAAAYTSGSKLPGPAVEAAAHEIQRYGRPCVFVRAEAATDGADGTLDTTDFAGTSVPTLDGDNDPLDDCDVVIEFPTGGTIGVAGIKYRYSLDGGETFSALLALGIANSLSIAALGETTWAVDFGAGTITSGSILRVSTTAPQPDATTLLAALNRLRDWAGRWEEVHVIGQLTATLFDVVDTAVSGLEANGKDRMWFGSFRMRNVGETDAAYKTAFDAALGAKSTTRGAVFAGDVSFASAVSGRRYRRPFAFVAVAREIASSHEINTADVDLGPLPGSIRDANGNPLHHDETVSPGLDDSRAYVARSHDEFPGVYVNQPRIFSSETSDFQFVPHRRVMNLAKSVLRAYLKRRLSKPIRVSKKTGFILESEARAIEKGATRALEAALLAKPKASGVTFVLSREDNVLSTKTLTGSCSIVPLAYPTTINVDPISYTNPALIVQQAA